VAICADIVTVARLTACKNVSTRDVDSGGPYGKIEFRTIRPVIADGVLYTDDRGGIAIRQKIGDQFPRRWVSL
jgi:hypothetical protein